ncbi:MAG: hypothetical protein KGI33_01610 [Thaumarchaeota archaeon]|nr:hypothetical protein [Nitrososphaerota archaeon]
MGLSVAISGGIVTFAIIYAMVSFSSEVGDSAKVGTSQAQMANNMFQRLQTDVTMSNLTAQNTVGPATFQITNTGNTLLWNYDNFDVIITYQENGTLAQQLLGQHPTVTEALTYSPTCASLMADRWCISSIQNDYVHKGLIDPGEVANVEVQPANVPWKASTFTAEFGTDNGVTTSESVSTT